MQTYNYDKELIKDFIKWVSDTHKCTLVVFPDNFSSSRFASYRFVNVGNLIEEFMNDFHEQD